MNDGEGRAARRLFRDAHQFENFMNEVLYRAVTGTFVHVRTDVDSWFDAMMGTTKDSRFNVQAMLRIADKMSIQRDHLPLFSFYLAACLEATSGPNGRAATVPVAYANSQQEWTRMLEATPGYIERVLRHHRRPNFYVLKYVNDLSQKGFDPDYLRIISLDPEDSVFTMLYSVEQLEGLFSGGVPAEYARDLRFAERTFSLNHEDVVRLYGAGVPIEYVTACVKNAVYPHNILRFWEEGIPVEYAALV